MALIGKDRFELCWIVDFPMYEWNEEEKKIDFSHNPFSMPNMPVDEFLALDATDRDKILALKAIQYDIVCNGVELSSGAIRNHRPEVMKKAFAIAGYDESVLEQKFGGMLHALSLGAPPHGGIAPGIDRIVMLLCGEENLREVVLFPMNQRAEDLMMGAPSEVTPSSCASFTSGLSRPVRVKSARLERSFRRHSARLDRVRRIARRRSRRTPPASAFFASGEESAEIRTSTSSDSRLPRPSALAIWNAFRSSRHQRSTSAIAPRGLRSSNIAARAAKRARTAG